MSLRKEIRPDLPEPPLISFPNLNGRIINQISFGDVHTGILFNDGSVELFGLNSHGQCTIPNLNGLKVTQLSCGGLHTGLILIDNTVILFGCN